MKNLFEQALLRNELVKFIQGEGEYFILDREYGGHWCLMSYRNYIEPYLSINKEILPDEFWRMVNEIFESHYDKNLFLDNLIAIFIPYYNVSDKEILRLRIASTPIESKDNIKQFIKENSENLTRDKRGTGVEWNSNTGLLGGITNNLKIISQRGGPNFLPDEFI